MVIVEMIGIPKIQVDGDKDQNEQLEDWVQVGKVSLPCYVKCDCSSCIQIKECEDLKALAMTRAKGKALMKWNEHNKVK